MNEQELSLNFFDKVFNFIKLKTNSLHKNIYDRLEKRQLLKKFDDQLDRMIIDARLIGLTDDELTAIIVKNFDLNHSKFSISSKYFNQKFIIGISFFVLLISFLSTCTICKRYGMRFGRRILFQVNLFIFLKFNESEWLSITLINSWKIIGIGWTLIMIGVCYLQPKLKHQQPYKVGR